jgi:M-phase inducer tyrosine phosphatase
METSSPLATMQSSTALFGHCGYKGFGPNSFNFKDLSMKKSQSDYFAMMPMRGSSPTASLAADFGQNLGFGLR